LTNKIFDVFWFFLQSRSHLYEAERSKASLLIYFIAYCSLIQWSISTLCAVLLCCSLVDTAVLQSRHGRN